MPTYEYRCPNGHEFEHFYRKISDATAELACSVCGEAATRKVSGGAGLLFKGSGFYLTDYGKNAHRRSAPDATSGAKGDGKQDSGGANAGSAGASSGESGGSTGSSKSESSTKSDSTSSASKSTGGDAK